MILTDGWSQDNTKKAVAEVAKRGVITFAIGLGLDRNRAGIKELAQNDTDKMYKLPYAWNTKKAASSLTTKSQKQVVTDVLDVGTMSVCTSRY